MSHHVLFQPTPSPRTSIIPKKRKSCKKHGILKFLPNFWLWTCLILHLFARARLAFFPSPWLPISWSHLQLSHGCWGDRKCSRVWIDTFGAGDFSISKHKQQKVLNQPHGNSKYRVSHSPNHPKRSPMATVPLQNRSHNRIIYIEHRWTCLGTKQAKQCQTNDEEQETSNGFKWVSCHDLVRASRI